MWDGLSFRTDWRTLVFSASCLVSSRGLTRHVVLSDLPTVNNGPDAAWLLHLPHPPNPPLPRMSVQEDRGSNSACGRLLSQRSHTWTTQTLRRHTTTRGELNSNPTDRCRCTLRTMCRCFVRFKHLQRTRIRHSTHDCISLLTYLTINESNVAFCDFNSYQETMRSTWNFWKNLWSKMFRWGLLLVFWSIYRISLTIRRT